MSYSITPKYILEQFLSFFMYFIVSLFARIDITTFIEKVSVDGYFLFISILSDSTY